jgi:hypothetical protein
MVLTSKKQKTELPIACNLTAIPAEQLVQHKTTAEQIFLAVGETRELPDGYAFRLPETSEMLLKAAEFVSNERLCCSFFSFTLEVEPQGGPLWLKLRGSEGVKPFIQAEVLPWSSSLAGSDAAQVAKQTTNTKLYPNNIDQEVTQMVIKDQGKENEPALFCDLSALQPEERKQHQLTTEQLSAGITQIEELPNGYAFPLPEEPEILSRAAEFIKYERLCCPFLSFALEVEPQGEPFRLKLTGPEGVKQFLLFELNLENKLIL